MSRVLVLNGVWSDQGIGEALRELLGASEAASTALGPGMAARLSLSEKVLSSDMAKLVEAMKRARNYAHTVITLKSSPESKSWRFV